MHLSGFKYLLDISGRGHAAASFTSPSTARVGIEINKQITVKLTSLLDNVFLQFVEEVQKNTITVENAISSVRFACIFTFY